MHCTRYLTSIVTIPLVLPAPFRLHPAYFLMGLSFRKSVKVGPFRLNFSTRGVGYSIGGAGFRTGVSPSGRSYTTFSAPGTGLSYRTTGGKGCVLFFLGLGGAGSVAWALTRFIS